jgi:chromosome segregation ATPase
VDKKANDTFAFDLENRLDDFFSDALPSQDEPPADAPPAPKTDLPLKELKSTILAIDWEITDDVLETLIDQLDGLLEQFQDDKVIHTLLKLLKSLGKYVRTHKSNAHPDTIKRIMAVYSALEESITNQEMSRDAKEKLVMEEVRQFQRLKAKIVASPSAYLPSGLQKPIKSGEISGIEAVISAIDDLKSMMARELGAIREELGQMHKK